MQRIRSSSPAASTEMAARYRAACVRIEAASFSRPLRASCRARSMLAQKRSSDSSFRPPSSCGTCRSRSRAPRPSPRARSRRTCSSSSAVGTFRDCDCFRLRFPRLRLPDAMRASSVDLSTIRCHVGVPKIFTNGLLVRDLPSSGGRGRNGRIGQAAPEGQARVGSLSGTSAQRPRPCESNAHWRTACTLCADATAVSLNRRRRHRIVFFDPPTNRSSNRTPRL